MAVGRVTVPRAPAIEDFPDPGADYGEVFTRRWVVDMILDLVGYDPAEDLGARVIVEPSCGTGSFLGAIVERLGESARRHGRELTSLGGAIVASEILDGNARVARKTVAAILVGLGATAADADELAAGWISSGDFLLEQVPTAADYVVGNPPYVRLESVPRSSMAAYRRAWPTMRGRSDLYVGFFERGLNLLRPGGKLAYICADRWMHNRYGAGLRALVSRQFAVDAVVSLHAVDAFEHDVSAYPAVVVLRSGQQQHVTLATAGNGFGPEEARALTKWVRGSSHRPHRGPAVSATRLSDWSGESAMWPCGSATQVALVQDLEQRFPPLEDPRTGTKVGIGLATGCDDVFLTKDPDLVEPARLLPLLRSQDTRSGNAQWTGSYLVNPWDNDGLVDLDEFPRLRAHLESRREVLLRRYVARRRTEQWYRTIDRVAPGLLETPKLVLPDLKAASHPVLDDGETYPHHNLYYVRSDRWDLEVLGGLLLSEVANLFVGAYCVKMRGGCFRFQAQYLRRLRVPMPEQVNPRDSRALARAFRARDVAAASRVASSLYGVDHDVLLSARQQV